MAQRCVCASCVCTRMQRINTFLFIWPMMCTLCRWYFSATFSQYSNRLHSALSWLTVRIHREQHVLVHRPYLINKLMLMGFPVLHTPWLRYDRAWYAAPNFHSLLENEQQIVISVVVQRIQPKPNRLLSSSAGNLIRADCRIENSSPVNFLWNRLININF